MKAKLTSRKFWAALAEFVAMLLVFFNYPQDKTAQITALIMAGATVIAYIVGEGLIDAAAAPGATAPTNQLKQAVSEIVPNIINTKGNSDTVDVVAKTEKHTYDTDDDDVQEE